MRVLFLGKRGDQYGQRALEYCHIFWSDFVTAFAGWGEPMPPEVREWEGDLILSYLSRWILPAELLARAKVASLNFHPGPPEFPGIGCTNVALYRQASDYGCTCHHMLPRVDTGPIVAVRRFAVDPEDNVATLTERTYMHQLVLFQEIVGLLAAGKPLPVAPDRWASRPGTRRELNHLMTLTPDMGQDEVDRRIRATSFGPWQPHLIFRGHRFIHKPADLG